VDCYGASIVATAIARRGAVPADLQGPLESGLSAQRRSARAGSVQSQGLGAAGSSGDGRPVTGGKVLQGRELEEQRRRIALGRMDQERLRLLRVVAAECAAIAASTRSQSGATPSEGGTQYDASESPSANRDDERLEQLRRAQTSQLQKRERQFALRLQKTVKAARDTMLRFRAEKDDERRRAETDMQREEEERRQKLRAYIERQDELRARARRDDDARAARARADAARLAERHQIEREGHERQLEELERAAARRHEQHAAKAAAGGRCFDRAQSTLRAQQQARTERKAALDAEQERLQEETEREEWERHQREAEANAKRRHEVNGRRADIKERSAQMQQRRVEAIEAHQDHKGALQAEWTRQHEEEDRQRRERLDAQRRHEADALERARAAERDFRERTDLAVHIASERSAQAVASRDQQRDLRCYERSVENEAIQQRTERARKARAYRALQLHEEWSAKMQTAEARAQQRDAAARKVRLESERLAAAALRQRHLAALGKPVDLTMFDEVLQRTGVS
jgi:colicin import membrane protein